MMQIILIESNDSLRDILKINIMKTLGCDVILKDTAADAISLIEILPSIDLVVCREQIETERTGINLSSFFEKESYSIPLLVIGKITSQYKFLFTVEADQHWKEIVISSGEILGVNVEFEDNKYENEFVPVALDYFYNITSTSMGCDVYIRIKKGDNYQFIKRLYSKDYFTREDIEKYKSTGLKEFYISKDHHSQFVNYVTSQLVLKLESKDLSSLDRMQLTSEAHSLSLERLQSVGVDNHIITIVEESIKSMEKLLHENNALSNFLLSLRSNKLSYAYSHAYLCSLMLHKVIAAFDWSTASIKEKLTYIAYFHDISLTEDLMKYRSVIDLERSNLSSEVKKKVINHANLSADIIDKFPKVPIGVSSIIKEHHGSKSGSGFPDSLSIGITQLSMMFIVVEHFVDEFLKIVGPPSAKDFERIFTILSAKYNKVTYGQTVDALKNIIKNKK